MTPEQFAQEFGYEPSPLDIKWLKFTEGMWVIVPGPERRRWVPVVQAFNIADDEKKLYPVPPNGQERVYGKIVENLTLEEFALEVDDIPDTEDFIFSLFANYELNPKPKCRDRWTTAQDAEDWMPYLLALGYTFEGLKTLAERNELIKPVEPETP